MASSSPTPRTSFLLSGLILLMIAVPAGFTLHTVRVSAQVPAPLAASSPYGYTVSLLLFIVPLIVILFWLVPTDRVAISKKSFLYTLIALVPTGILVDALFAHAFFTFPNERAVLGVRAPALGGGVPVEEYIFYVTGFLAVLLLYIWMDEYWLAAYSVPGDAQSRKEFKRLLTFHPQSLILAVILIVAAIIVRRIAAPGEGGFPGYFTYLVLVGLTPSVTFFKSALPVVNWRAFSLTMMFIVLMSLLWEATLASPYGWWGYQHAQMMGIYITAWNLLPLEAVVVWIAVTYATVVIYETIRRWQASGRPVRHAMLGARATERAMLHNA